MRLLPFFGFEFIGRDWFTGAGLRLGIVSGSSWTFFGVLPFTYLGTTILEPYLSGTKCTMVFHKENLHINQLIFNIYLTNKVL